MASEQLELYYTGPTLAWSCQTRAEVNKCCSRPRRCRNGSIFQMPLLTHPRLEFQFLEYRQPLRSLTLDHGSNTTKCPESLHSCKFLEANQEVERAMSMNGESSDIASVYFLGEMVTKSLNSPNRVRSGALSTIASEHGELAKVQFSAR
jgi:hypothetical protein